MCYSGMESRPTGAGFRFQRCWTWLLLWWTEQKLGLPGVTAAKILARDQLDVVGGSWQVSTSPLPSPRGDRFPAPSWWVALVLLGAVKRWCLSSQFLCLGRPAPEGSWETRAALTLSFMPAGVAVGLQGSEAVRGGVAVPAYVWWHLSVWEQAGNWRASVCQGETSPQLFFFSAFSAAGPSWHSWAQCHDLFPTKLSQRGKLQGRHERGVGCGELTPHVKFLKRPQTWDHHSSELRNH